MRGGRGGRGGQAAGPRQAAAQRSQSLHRPGGSHPQALERLRPGAAAAAAPPPAEAAGDISALIASEVADLKDASKQTFYWHSTGVNSVIYVELKDAGGRSAAGRGGALML